MSNIRTEKQTILTTTINVSVATHPKGLYLLFFTELWERFGFYTLQAIIILYMTKGLAMNDAQANLFYAAFSAMLYLSPTIGGYLADKYLGFQRAIMIGGLLFILAYLVCASSNQTLFFLGLSILICANGLFKPNVSSIVGELYHDNDPRRDGGFTLFYMGINVGALIPPLMAGMLVANYGWHAGFFAAAIGMTIGQLIFQLGRGVLGEAGLHPKVTKKQPALNFYFYFLLFGGIVACVSLCLIAFKYATLTNYIVEASAIAVFAMVLFYLLKEPVEQRKKMLAALILIIISAAFWSLYNQAFTSLMLFADRHMEKHFLGFSFDAEASQFFNPFFIIALSPIFSRLWIRMDHAGLNPSTQMKFFLGILFICFGFIVLALGVKVLSTNNFVSPWLLCSSYLLQTIGELLISPIGLAMITVLCPKRLVGMMMGVWFFAQAASFAIGGFLANIAAVPEHLTTQASLSIYSNAFAIYGVIALCMAAVSFACLPLLNRLVRE